MKKILLLTDMSEAANNALQFTRSFFSDTLVDFHLLYALPAEPGKLRNPILAVKKPRSILADQLDELVTGLRREATNDWHTFRSSACPGELTEVVQGVLKVDVYDFLVIGTDPDDTNGCLATVPLP